MTSPESGPVQFERVFLEDGHPFTQIGSGACGGKASGLYRAYGILQQHPYPGAGDNVRIDIPASVVLATDVFEQFMRRNALYEIALSDEPDDRIAHAFQQADFPIEFVGDLLALVDGSAGRPLAVRSSSLLEDALAHPFAGVYRTKMIPNNQPDPSARFRRLVEAVKFVFASTFFHAAAAYMKGVGVNPRDERMAVLIQEIVGTRKNDRFYPEVSGVSRSFNYYRTGEARPEDGVVSLALGLGKTIVDGGRSWSYSPTQPSSRAAFASIDDLLKNTQLDFWAVHLGPPPAYDPIRETEYMVRAELRDADRDDSLRFVASTYDAGRERLMAGVSSSGPRVLDFAPILRYDRWPISDVVGHVMEIFEREMDTPVEIEFAVSFERGKQANGRLAVLQVRPMRMSGETVDLPQIETINAGLLVYSDQVMGHGVIEDIRDVVFVKPEPFDRSLTVQIASEVDAFNETLREAKRPYLLIGFGRWGSSERWLGIPVAWGQISGARVIVEATIPEINVDLSQGSHFFHNLEALEVSYFCVRFDEDPPINWAWLKSQRVVRETETLCHIETREPITVQVDGRTGRGAIWHNEGSEKENNRSN